MRTLVGRERELALLEDSLTAVLAGSPRVVLCRGEPGIGKTRLVEALCGLAAARSARTAWGVAVQAAGAPSYWPWQQVLHTIARYVDLPAMAAQDRLTSHVALLAPDLFGAADGDPDGGSSADRFRMFDAVARLLGRVTREQPLVIVLDDAQWADAPSLLLLLHLARSLSGQRLLVVVAHRDTEVTNHVLLTELPREPVTEVLPVGGLTIDAVGAQLASLTGGEMAHHEVRRVHERTGGNPFFVAEIGRALAQRRDPGGGLPVPASVQNAIAARLSGLSLPTVRLVQAAAVVGRQFRVEVLARMVESPVLHCLTSLDEAVAAGFVEPTSTAAEHRFVHDLVREAVEAGLPTAERVRWHRAAAEVLEELHGDRPERLLSDLARHWAVAAVAGERERAAGWIRRASQEAMRRLAFEEAARLGRLALSVGAGELGDADRCRLLLDVGAALKQAGELTGRLEPWYEAADLARRLGRQDLLAEAALVLEGGESEVEVEWALRRLCEETLAALGPGATAARALVAANLATVCMYLGDTDVADVASNSALTAAERCGDSRALAAAWRARQLVCSGPDGAADRARLADRMLALGHERRDAAAQMWAYLWKIDLALQRGDLTAVIRHLEALTPCVQELPGPVGRWHLLQCRAVLAQAQGRFADARRLADRALATLPLSGTARASALVNHSALMFALDRHTGGDFDARGLLASGDTARLDELLDFPTSGVILTIGAAFLLASSGRLTDAGIVYRRLGPPATWRPIPHAKTVCFAFGIATAVELGRREDVSVLYDLLLPYRGQHIVSGAGCVAYNGPVDLYLGTAAGHVDRLDDAVDHLEAAAGACAAHGAPGFGVEVGCELTAALARRSAPGDLARARAVLMDVTRQALALGMHPWLDRARRLAERFDDERGAPLTPREREVAALVAQGLTNREIAERLYLSERTAQNHVQHILTKLRLPNRGQIAVWATRMSTPAE